MRACPYCERDIQDEAIVCRYCGLDVEPPGWLRGKERCPYCTEWISTGQSLCPYCKSDLNEAPPSSVPSAARSPAAPAFDEDAAFLDEVERDPEPSPAEEPHSDPATPNSAEPKPTAQQPYSAPEWAGEADDDPLRSQPLEEQGRRFAFTVPEAFQNLPTGRLLRTGGLVLLIVVVGGLVALARRYQDSLPSFSAAAVTETPTPTEMTPDPTVTDNVVAVATGTGTAPATTSPSGCVRWDEITLDQEGEEMCVYGTVKRWFSSGDLLFVAIFTEEPGTFALVDRTRNYRSIQPGDCISGEGPIGIMSATRPFIDLNGEVGECPE